ncbi:MAG: hypothetical protein Q9187_006561 [Circinaria calcarea]
MADPLSITASIVAVIGAARVITKTLGKIKNLRNAPNELLALFNEVSDLRIILEDLQHYILQNIERPQILQEELQHISILVDRAKDKLLELDEFIQYRLVKPESISDQIKVSKRKWARAKDSIERFRQSLRDIRLNISTHMIVVNSSHQTRIGLTIDEIHVISGQLRSNHHLSSDHTSQQLDQHSRLLASISSSQSTLQALPARLFASEPTVLNDHPALHIAQVFRLALSDDVDGLKRLFSKGLASPNDSLRNGATALYVAISICNLKACKFLLEAGANPHLEILTGGRSAFDYTWDIIFAASKDQAVLKSLKSLFPSEDNDLEERQFSSLHKIVLNITSRSLEEGLAICASDIDRIDSKGNTALTWAARRGDCIAVDLLLKANADPNLVNRLNMSPFLYAAQRSDPICAKLLLKAGADPNQVDSQKYNALHYAAGYQNSRKMIEYLVEAGVDVNKRNNSSGTPLSQAVIQDYTISAKALLDYGADLNTLDFERDTPLTDSIRNNADNMTELLLHRGAAYISSDVYGDTILHLGALCGGSKTLSILQAAELKGVNPDATNNKGQTAIQIAREREGKPHGLIPQFQDLLGGIRARNASSEASSEQSSDPVSPDSTSNSQAYLLLPAKWVRQLWVGSINRRSGPHLPSRLSTTIPHQWTAWGLRVFWTHWVLSLCGAGLLYLFLNFGVLRRLRTVWDMLGPGGFEEV